MTRAFLDASVLYSAIVSASGASRELLYRHLSGQVQLVASQYVLKEAERNLAAKNPTSTGSVSLLVDLLELELVEVSAEDIQTVAQYTPLKDAPVVAAAQIGNCDYLLTFDRKHLLGNQEVATKANLTILTAGDLVQQLRREEN